MRTIIVLLALSTLLFSCNQQADRQKVTAASKMETAVQQKDTAADMDPAQPLPFIGQRWFETRPGYSGTGTPHRYVEILKNGNVYFGFEQENQGDKIEGIENITSDKYYAGKFKPVLKCFFSTLGEDSTFYYEITKDKIYEIDEHGNRRISEDCSDPLTDSFHAKCLCQSLLDTL
jgi:hypothetical protein